MSLRRKAGLFLLATLSITPCWAKHLPWRTIHEKGFTFRLPATVKKKNVQGIDSYVGKYVGKSIVVDFDLGPSSNELDPKFLPQGSTVRESAINGRPARIAEWKLSNGVKALAASLRKRNGMKLTMTIFYSDVPDRAVARQIIRSIHLR